MANERDKAAKGVDSVTDYVDVREDASLAGGVAALSASASAADSAAAVVIKASDVALLQEELDLTKDAAEGLLRRARGDLAAALSSYIQGGM